MKTIILIAILSLSVTLSSYKPQIWTKDNKIAVSATEGLFGEVDCAPGMIWYLLRNGQDLTEQPPYTFQFCPDNTLIAVGSYQKIPGTCYKDYESNTVTIEIKGPHYIFELISGTWQIIEHSEDALELQTFENGENRQVRFQRIQR